MCIFSSVPASVILFDLKASLLDANSRCLDYHGVSELKDLKPGLELTGHWKPLISEVRKVLRGRSSLVEYCFSNPKTSTTRWVKAALSPVLDENNALIGVSIIERDNTFQRELLSELKQINRA